MLCLIPKSYIRDIIFLSIFASVKSGELRFVSELILFSIVLQIGIN